MSEHKHTPGPWFASDEGVIVFKRQLFDEDGNHAGYELLDGDYDALAHALCKSGLLPERDRLLAAVERLRAENAKLREALKSLVEPATEIRWSSNSRPDVIAVEAALKLARAALAEGKSHER